MTSLYGHRARNGGPPLSAPFCRVSSGTHGSAGGRGSATGRVGLEHDEVLIGPSLPTTSPRGSLVVEESGDSPLGFECPPHPLPGSVSRPTGSRALFVVLGVVVLSGTRAD